MTQISAADNLLIDAKPDRWQMRINTNFVENVQGDGVLMEAADGQPLRYTSLFASTRRLPKSGSLSTEYIQRVVLGWSWDDEAWHLGFLFEDKLAKVRGSRWCAIARWPDPERELYEEIAVNAGKTLAVAVGRPFNLIPIKEPDTAIVETLKPLPEPPLALQTWVLQRGKKQGWLVFVRDPAWARERVRRAIWYSIWVVVYILLSVATLLSDIARPRPEFLPYLGFATAVLLVGLVIYALYELRTRPRRIIIDPTTRQVWGNIKHGGKPIWRKARAEIDSVYVSEVVKNEKSNSDTKEDTQSVKPAVVFEILHSELNLRLTNGAYFFLLKQEEPETITDALPGKTDGIQPLHQNDVVTRIQAAAVYIGQALDVPTWYDRRPH